MQRLRAALRMLVGLVVGTAVLLAATTAPAAPAAAGFRVEPGAAASTSDARYVALGDSFSAGEGTFVYRRATDTASNRCHRSHLAYGPLLSRLRRPPGRLGFVACSGAQTRDLYAPNHAYPAEPPQLDALSAGVRTVTLTLGGNDLGFADVLAACVQEARTSDQRCSRNPLITRAVSARLAALAGAPTTGTGWDYPITPISRVLADIARRAPAARVYLAGYPLLFGDRTADFRADPTVPSGYACPLHPAGAVLDYADAQFLNEATVRLNRVLRAAVERARAAGLQATYVPMTAFEGHARCDERRPWIRPLLLTPDRSRPLAESLHPTFRGQLGYAQALRAAGI